MTFLMVNEKSMKQRGNDEMPLVNYKFPLRERREALKNWFQVGQIPRIPRNFVHVLFSLKKTNLRKFSDDGIFNIKYGSDISSLSRAAAAGNLDDMQKLLSRGKLPEVSDNNGWTTIHHCISSNQCESLDLVLKMGRKRKKKRLVNLTTFENHTPLFMALKLQQPSYDMVKALLEAGADPNIRSHTNVSPLHLACQRNESLAFVELLVDHGADVNAVDDITGSTPLHFAVGKGQDPRVVEYLLRICDLSIRNSSGRTPFVECCFSNFTEGVKLFVVHDESLVKGTAEEVPPLGLAAFLGNATMFDILLRTGASVNTVCKAMVADPGKEESFGTLLDVENYLPIHSSLTSLPIFKALLKLTSPCKIQKLQSDYCDFPLFVLVHGSDAGFFESLLQSDLPESLKSINPKSLVNFLWNCSWERELIINKFHVCFKYDFHLEPGFVFEGMVERLNVGNLRKVLGFLCRLVEMQGIPPRGSTEVVQRILTEFAGKEGESHEDRHMASRIADSLRVKVPSLTELARLAVRRGILASTTSNWTAYATIKASDLPEEIKKHLLYENVVCY